MPSHKKHEFSCKVWIEQKGRPLLGKGGASILEEIDRTKSISETSKNLGMSYRYVWNYLQQLEKSIGGHVIETHRGGKLGGGSTILTELGRGLLQEYERVEGYLEQVLEDKEYWEMISLKISARNHLKGKVVSVRKNDVTAQVKVEVAVPTTVTALISKEAVDDLNIKVGDTVEAVIKATEVMIAK